MGAFGHDVERRRDHVGDVILTDLRFHVGFLVIVRVALHVELTEGLQIIDFGL